MYVLFLPFLFLKTCFDKCGKYYIKIIQLMEKITQRGLTLNWLMSDSCSGEKV